MKKILKMKRIYISIFCALFLCAAAGAQDGKSAFYSVTATGKAVAAELPAFLDSWYNTFNAVFHFSKTGPGFLFQVTLYDSAEEYRNYVKGKTGGNAPASEAVFLRYSNAQRSEVVAVASSVGQPVFTRQLFLQYLTCYLPDYPQWLFGGYSLLFENPGAKQNPWAETAKKLFSDSARKLSLSHMLAAQKNDFTGDRLFPQAMLLVRFLEQNPDNTYRRMLFEGIENLKAGKNAAAAFTDYAEYWIGLEKADDDFSIYVSSLRTVNELIASGIEAYTQNDLEAAFQYFTQVTELDLKNATAEYYLGLTAYKQKNFSMADVWYKKALESGANAALINWALSVSAFADERYSDAAVYAAQAKTLDRAAYGQKADDLIMSIPKQ